MSNAIDFSLGYDLGPMRAQGAQAIALNARVMQSIGNQFKLTEQSGKNIRNMLGGIGLGAVAAGVGGGRAIARFAGEITDLSASVGLGTDEFQRYSFALEQNGGKQTDLVRGMGALIQKTEEAKEGNEKTIASFQSLGISMSDLRTKAPDQLLLKIADALKESGADAQTTADVMDLLGSKVALKLIPALKDGSEGFLRLGADAKIMSKDTIAAVDEMADTFDKWKRNAMGGVANLFVGVKNAMAGGVTLMDGFKDAAGFKTPGIMTGAVPQEEINKMAEERKKAVGLPDVPALPNMTKPPEPFANSRFGAKGLSLIGFNSSLGNKRGLGSGGEFETAFTPSLWKPLMEGGSSTMLGNTGGLSTGGLGTNGGAYGAVRRGDSKREAAAKSAEAAELEKLNQKFDDYWGTRK